MDGMNPYQVTQQMIRDLEAEPAVVKSSAI
jgi:hypothetical protein